MDHLEEILSQFDQIIGLELLKAFHINDSMNVRESHKDRLPFILETPTDLAGHAEEIRCLKGKYRWSRMT